MAAGTVRVRGLRELARTFKHMPADVRKEIRAELRSVGEAVAEDARERIGAHNPRSASGIKHRLKHDREVVVEQNRSATTGKRGDWGSHQMRHMLEARAAKRAETIRRLEDALDRVANRHGF